MKTILFYYTGTGNSLWISRQLGDIIRSDVSIYAMKNWQSKAVPQDMDAVGLVFPVHIWGLPQAVIDFVNQLPVDSSTYNFALAVNGGQVAATLVQLQKLMKKRGLNLDAGFDLTMPSNYIPWGGPGSGEEIEKRYKNARGKLAEIAYTVEKKYPMEVEKGPLWQRTIFSLLYKLSFKNIRFMDKGFWVDDKCTQCGLCEKVCPTHNIKMNKVPQWQHQCEQCLACIQWCPVKAIQYGKKTPQLERYHHPEVTITDIINSHP